MTRAASAVVLACLTCLTSLCVASWDAAGSSQVAEVRSTRLGVLGHAGRFATLTGQRSTIRHAFIGWHQPRTLRKLLHDLKPLPMVAIKTGGVVTPLGIAQGQGDGFLVELNSTLAGFGARVYVRPMPEMNGHWNEYSAFDRSGASRGPQYSTAAFRRAFARIALIARGGPARVLNAKLRRLGQAAHRNKQFGIAEWGLWGIDDPAFVERMAAFVRTGTRRPAERRSTGSVPPPSPAT